MSIVKAPCRRDYYPAFRTSGRRPISAIHWIVLHTTEGGTAESVARYFHGGDAGGSAHLVIDDDSCQRCLPNSAVPWGAPGANTNGFHIEQAGHAAWTHDDWERHLPMLHRVAYKVAVHAARFKIPLRFCNAVDLRAGKKGVTTHKAVSTWQAAIHAPGDHSHWDPGPDYPMGLVLAMARHYHAELKG